MHFKGTMQTVCGQGTSEIQQFEKNRGCEKSWRRGGGGGFLSRKVAAAERGCFADGKAHGNMKARNTMDLTIVIWRSYYEYIAAGFLETLASAIGSESGADIGFSFASVIFPILVIIKLTISTVALISLIVPTATWTLPIRLPRMPITETIAETKNVSWESVVEFEKGDCSLDEEIN